MVGNADRVAGPYRFRQNRVPVISRGMHLSSQKVYGSVERKDAIWKRKTEERRETRDSREKERAQNDVGMRRSGENNIRVSRTCIVDLVQEKKTPAFSPPLLSSIPSGFPKNPNLSMDVTDLSSLSLLARSPPSHLIHG